MTRGIDLLILTWQLEDAISADDLAADVRRMTGFSLKKYKSNREKGQQRDRLKTFVLKPYLLRAYERLCREQEAERANKAKLDQVGDAHAPYTSISETHSSGAWPSIPGGVELTYNEGSFGSEHPCRSKCNRNQY